MSTVDLFKFVRIAARAADEKIGEDIVAFDVRKASSLADCFLLVTGSTHIHIRAIEDAIREALREAGAELRRTDGRRGHLWRVLDYGFLIVHLMDQKTREYYAMEKLWERAKMIPLGTGRDNPVAKKVKPRRKPSKVSTPKRSKKTSRVKKAKKTSRPRKKR